MTRDQHFMINKNVMERVLECSKINRDDIVLEIGAGTGSLTVMLAERAKRVIAIEIDEGFEDKLNEIAKKYGNIKVIIGNALEIIK
ncbi:MAG TPA: methyltransferase domain-containing protein, partial [Candidatus Aenigmarchaeota archaeon]|nr:methyltransferase domain-containing protein [Candidatus Aenigmarchaeota archaeon]